MFDSSYILEITYELTIFFLFVICFMYCFKLFLLPFIRQRFRELKQHWNTLRNKRNLLTKTIASLDEKTKQQRKNLNTLEKKVHIWHAAITQEVQLQKKELKVYIEKLSEKKKEQNALFHKEKLKQEVIPCAVNKAHKKFEEYYKGTEGKKLLSVLLKRLKQTNNQHEVS